MEERGRGGTEEAGAGAGEGAAEARAFAGMTFANGGLSQRAWGLLQNGIRSEGGVVVPTQPSPLREKTRGTHRTTFASGGGQGARQSIVAAPTPTHVVVTDNAPASAREAAKRLHEGAEIVTHSWVSERRRTHANKRKAAIGGGDARPAAKTTRVASVETAHTPAASALIHGAQTTALVSLPASGGDAFPRQHPNWALMHPPVATEEDHTLYGRSPGEVMSKVERVLQCEFNAARGLNEGIVGLLIELAKYERLGGGDNAQHVENLRVDGQQRFNEMELAYARAAAVVRALPYRLRTEVKTLTKADGVPFLGPSVCIEISQMVKTGTSETLEAHRKGAAGGGALRHTSSGRIRGSSVNERWTLESRTPRALLAREDPEDGGRGLELAVCNVEGSEALALEPLAERYGGGRRASLLRGGTIQEAAAQRNLQKLPSLGLSTASKLIMEHGITTLEGLKRDVNAGGKSRELLNKTQLSCLNFHEELTGKVTAQEVVEMQEAVLAAARGSHEALDESKWEVTAVGGSRRGDASHDADFIVAHPGLRKHSQLRGLLRKILARLGHKIMGGDAALERGDLDEHTTAFHMLCEDKMDSLWTKLSTKVEFGGKLGGSGNADYFDKLFGIYRTVGGAHRRIDIILVPYVQLPFALVGWTGSRTYNRFLRLHAENRGMFLNNHCLVRRRDRMVVGQEADDGRLERCGMKPHPPAAPLDSAGKEWWPPGWADEKGRWNGRVITCEADIFQLLGVPYKHPKDRDCPT